MPLDGEDHEMFRDEIREHSSEVVRAIRQGALLTARATLVAAMIGNQHGFRSVLFDNLTDDKVKWMNGVVDRLMKEVADNFDGEA